LVLPLSDISTQQNIVANANASIAAKLLQLTEFQRADEEAAPSERSNLLPYSRAKKAQRRVKTFRMLPAQLQHQILEWRHSPCKSLIAGA
jgi:hypothetical protein